MKLKDTKNKKKIPKTGLRKAEELQRQFNALMDDLPIPYYRIGPDMKVQKMNKALADLIGQTVEDCIGKHMKDIIDAKSFALAEKRFPQHRKDKPLKPVKYKVNLEDGKIIYLESRGKPVFDNGTFLYLHGLIHDITEKTEADEKIQTLISALESVQHGIFICDLNGKITYSNRYLCSRFGYSPREMAELEIYDLIFPADFSDRLYENIIHKSLKQGWRGELTCVPKKGDPFPCHMTTSCVVSKSGKPIAIIGVITDMTVEKKMESDLIQAEKMITIGKLAAGVAHEINNPLTALTYDLETLKEQLKQSKEFKVRLKRMENVTSRISTITRHLLTFSRQKSSPLRQSCDIHELLKNSLMLARVSNKKDIKIRKAFDEKIPRLRLDPIEIEQVFLNLVMNAFQATPVLGTLKIRTRFRPRKGVVEIFFQDNGSGIERTDMSKIFDPFFTTKNGTEHVGLGLSISHGIIANHGGCLTVNNNIPGPGVTFQILLPVKGQTLLQADAL